MSTLVKVGRLNPSRTFLLLCDLQEKFTKSIQYFDEIFVASDRLYEASKLLEIPAVVTEHYPKGLGKTVPSLRAKIEADPNAKIIEKTLFSMCTPEFLEHLNKTRPGNFVFQIQRPFTPDSVMCRLIKEKIQLF